MAEVRRRGCRRTGRRRWRGWRRRRPVGDFPRGRSGAGGRGPARRGRRCAAALREGRARDMAAGRSLVGPHRDDLGATYAGEGHAGAARLDRGAEGAARQPRARQRPGGGRGLRRAAAAAARRGHGASRRRPPRRAVRGDPRSRIAGLDDRHRGRSSSRDLATGRSGWMSPTPEASRRSPGRDRGIAAQIACTKV